MHIERIHSSELPGLQAPVKEVINRGLWMLCRPDRSSPGHDPAVTYVIKGKESLYRLDATGEVLSIDDVATVPPIDAIVYFHDLPMPPSLSEGGRRPLTAAPRCCAPVFPEYAP